MSLWSNILFNCVVVINLIVAFFYPFDNTVPELSSHMSCLIWAIMIFSFAIVITLPRESGIRTLVASVILRFIFSLGPEPTMWLLGSITVCIFNWTTIVKALVLVRNSVLLKEDSFFFYFFLIGCSEVRSYRKHNGQPWYPWEEFSQNNNRRTVTLSFWLLTIMSGWPTISSVFLFGFGKHRIILMFFFV